jgi:hypothetical protein
VNTKAEEIAIGKEVERMTREWSAIAGEPVEVLALQYSYIARMSELGALRLEHKMNRIGTEAIAVNSRNFGSWIFRVARLMSIDGQ